MIYFNILKDDEPALDYSPLLRGILCIMNYAEQNAGVGLTKSGAFGRDFIHRAARELMWPGFSAEELFAVNKVLNEADFPPMVDLHEALLATQMCRHDRGKLKLTGTGQTLAKQPGMLFGLVTPFYLTQVDHSRHGRMSDYSIGNWDVWLNIINVETETDVTGSRLREALYGKPLPGTSFDAVLSDLYIQVLRPLCWAGVLAEGLEQGQSLAERTFRKTPLWAAALQLRTDGQIMREPPA